MAILMLLAVFGMAVFISLALLRTMAHRDLYEKRLEQLKSAQAKNKGESGKKPAAGFAVSIIRSIARIFARRSFTEEVQIKLIHAGIMLKGEEFITICLVLLIFIPLLVGIFSENLWLALGLLIIGIFIPGCYLNYKRDKRKNALTQQLGDALVVMANALRAGFGFQQAMAMVHQELPPPIAVEFGWTLREMNLGFNQEEALLNMGKRAGNKDLDMVITGILIQRQVGGNLAEILDNISTTIRERAQLQREIRILTAQGRLSGLIIGFLPLGIMMAMLAINPDYIAILFRDPRGIGILAAGGLMMIIGIVIIKKIVQIDL